MAPNRIPSIFTRIDNWNLIFNATDKLITESSILIVFLVLTFFQGSICLFFPQIVGYRGKEISHVQVNDKYCKQGKNSMNQILSPWSLARVKYANSL